MTLIRPLTFSKSEMFWGQYLRNSNLCNRDNSESKMNIMAYNISLPKKRNIFHTEMFLKKNQNIISVIYQVGVERKACNIRF